MTRLDALFVPNNILDCHIPDKIEIQTVLLTCYSGMSYLCLSANRNNYRAMKYIEIKSEGYTYRYDFEPMPSTDLQRSMLRHILLRLIRDDDVIDTYYFRNNFGIWWNSLRDLLPTVAHPSPPAAGRSK